MLLTVIHLTRQIFVARERAICDNYLRQRGVEYSRITPLLSRFIYVKVTSTVNLTIEILLYNVYISMLDKCRKRKRERETHRAKYSRRVYLRMLLSVETDAFNER